MTLQEETPTISGWYGHRGEGRGGRGQRRVTGAKHNMATEGRLTSGGGHTVQNTDHVSQNRTLDTYIFLLTKSPRINLI